MAKYGDIEDDFYEEGFYETDPKVRKKVVAEHTEKQRTQKKQKEKIKAFETNDYEENSSGLYENIRHDVFKTKTLQPVSTKEVNETEFEFQPGRDKIKILCKDVKDNDTEFR